MWQPTLWGALLTEERWTMPSFPPRRLTIRSEIRASSYFSIFRPIAGHVSTIPSLLSSRDAAAFAAFPQAMPSQG